MIAPPRRDDEAGLFKYLSLAGKKIILLLLGGVLRNEHLCSRKRA